MAVRYPGSVPVVRTVHPPGAGGKQRNVRRLDDVDDEVHATRLTAQGLSGPPATTVEQVVHRLLAVQAQDPRGARLAVRSRSTGLRSSDVDAALNDRTVLISTLNRGTLHLVRSEDYPWLQALTTPQLRTGNARRLQQEGVSPEAAERGVAAVAKALEDGPQTRDQLREVLVRADVPVQGQALVHVLMRASLDGLIVRGPMVGPQHAFVLVCDWLGPQPPVDRDTALAELARRYLAGHGPAGDRDLAVWAGLPLRDVRRGLSLAGDALVERPDALVELETAPEPAPLPAPRLLGSYDPVLLGWTSREDVVGPHRSLVTDNGLFRPFAMVGGRAVATWGYAGGRVKLAPLEPVSSRDTHVLATDATDVERFLSS